MNKQQFDKLVKEAIQPLICICGKHYQNDYRGGFISNSVTHIWYCSDKCGKETYSKLY